MTMSRKKSPTKMRLAVFSALSVLAAFALAASLRSGREETTRAAGAIVSRMPNVSVKVESGYLQHDEIVLRMPDLGSPGGMRDLARVQPLSGGEYRVSLYDTDRGSFNAPERMSLDGLASHIGRGMSLVD